LSSELEAVINPSEGLYSRREALTRATYRFVSPLKENGKPSRHEHFDMLVQRSCLAQFATIIDTDDLINYTHLVWRCGRSSATARNVRVDCQWLRHCMRRTQNASVRTVYSNTRLWRRHS
jgi:hypothetical protein